MAVFIPSLQSGILCVIASLQFFRNSKGSIARTQLRAALSGTRNFIPPLICSAFILDFLKSASDKILLSKDFIIFWHTPQRSQSHFSSHPSPVLSAHLDWLV